MYAIEKLQQKSDINVDGKKKRRKIKKQRKQEINAEEKEEKTNKQTKMITQYVHEVYVCVSVYPSV